MMYLIIIFISPLYFLLRKKWWGFILNSIMYGIAAVFLVTVVFAWIGFFFWVLALGHAGWFLRFEMMEKQAELIAQKIEEERKRGGI